MKYVVTFPRRLQPYESAWGLQVRALSINDISLAQYFRLVGSTAAGKSLSQVNWCCSGHFNLELFSHALGISEKTACTAFVDLVLGSQNLHPVSEVRHCSMCINHLYHSTWFFFPWLEECPVHGMTLQFCKACSTVFTPASVV